MLNLIAIGDPVIDTHVQIAEGKDCKITEQGGEKFLSLNYGKKLPIVDSFQSLGGNAANMAVGAVKLGLSSALLSTVGDDANGKMAMEFLKKFKVDGSLLNCEAGSATRYSIVLNYKGERTILSYSEKKNYIWPEPIPPCEWIYYTGLSEGFETVQEKLIALLTRHPTVRLAVNPGSYMLKYAITSLKEIIKRTDLLIVNLEEAEAILNTKLEKEKNVTAMARELAQLGAKEVAITDGGNGAWAGTGEETWHMDAYPAKVISKTGAGDAFSAAYISARSFGHGIPHALEWGLANSASVVSAHGPHAGLLDQKGIEKMIQKFFSAEPKQI